MTTYYVSSGAGNDKNSGTSQTTAFATLQAAADVTKPGDVVQVETGTYVAETGGGALDITTSGTATAPITYEAAPGAHPVIQVGAGAWAGILEDASWITIKGFTVAGNAQNVTLAYATSQQTNTNNPTTSADGIDVGYVGQTNTPAHVIVENNVVHDMPGGGIVATYSDYVTIQSNTVYNNAHYSPFGASGISLGFSQNIDASTGYKNFVTGNISYNNAQLIPTANAGAITDGEGIIIDDNSNDQTNGKLYIGRTLVENNLTYGNGGPGVEAYDSSNVDILYNTSYKNGLSAIDPFEVDMARANGGVVENNIMYAAAGGQTEGSNGSTNITSDYNVLYGSSSVVGSHDKRADPLFINAANANFQLQAGSPAIGAANAAFNASVDILGTTRSSPADIGAYASAPPTTPLPAPSPNDTVVKAGSTGAIIDSSGNTWTITTGGQVAVNGVTDATTASVAELAYVNSTIWQENSSNIWWGKTTPAAAWSPSAGTSVSPLPTTITIAPGPASTTVSLSQILVSATTGNHRVFITGNHDTLTLAGGTDTVTDKGGSNTYVIPAAGKGYDAFTGNILSINDTLDLRTVLAATNWNGDPSTVSGYLKVVDNAQGSVLFVTPAQGGSGTAVASIAGATTATVSTWLAHALT